MQREENAEDDRDDHEQRNDEAAAEFATFDSLRFRSDLSCARGCCRFAARGEGRRCRKGNGSDRSDESLENHVSFSLRTQTLYRISALHYPRHPKLSTPNWLRPNRVLD